MKVHYNVEKITYETLSQAESVLFQFCHRRRRGQAKYNSLQLQSAHAVASADLQQHLKCICFQRKKLRVWVYPHVP